MLRPAKAFDSCIVGAHDGVVGRLKDFHFDDRKWIVRYLVAETDSWLTSDVLLRPIADIGPQQARHPEERDSSTKQVRPYTPISPEKIRLRYDEPQLVGADGGTPAGFRLEYARDVCSPDDDPTVRSMRVVTGYTVEAVDGSVGSVGDFIIEDTGWSIQYLVIDLRDGERSKRVLLAPEWIGGISGLRSQVFADLDRASIAGAPGYDPLQLLKPDYPARIHAYYDSRLAHYGGYQSFL